MVGFGMGTGFADGYRMLREESRFMSNLATGWMNLVIFDMKTTIRGRV